MTLGPDRHLQAHVWRLGDLQVSRLSGELDGLTAPAALDRLYDALVGGKAMLVVDLTQVTFMASAGVGVLLAIRRHVAERSGRLVLVAPVGGRAWRLLELTRLLEVFEVRSDLQQAVRSAQADSADTDRPGGRRTPEVA
ncbi:STAS domain-containing protein [Planomonospora sp. ID67723]|uniref:STAS domain-containing protein n=1 Tax=Planomonospora sp. ID67723 TaxID=2738134 RepID=UPI0018C44FB3|nr:STAS domain-containing protein [Planomonospora sp. ID67723]MBG0832006.1 STAS domain-containing protein [Planomonospora sp. ID67723]